MSSPAPSGRRLPRALRISLIVVGALLLLPVVAIPIIAWAFDLGGVVRNQVMALKPGWEKEIGRGLDIGAVSVRLFPTIAVEIHDVVVKPEPERAQLGGPAAEPLFSLGSARVAVAAWPLLTSLGKQVRISGVELRAPSVHVVRFADGRLSYQDITDRLGAEDKPPSEPMSPETLEYLNGVRLGRAAITGATLAFHDLEGGTPGTTYRIEDLEVVASGVQLGKAFPIDVDAAVLAPGRNFHLGVTVGPVPRDLVLGPPGSLVERVELKVSALQVEPLLRFLPPPAGMGVRRALVEADLVVEMPASAGKIKLKGSLGAKQLVLARAAVDKAPRAAGAPSPPVATSTVIGQPTDVALKLDLTADPMAGDIDAPLLDVTIGVAGGEMGVGGKVELRSAYVKPQLRSLDLASRGITFERIAAVLPEGTLPRGGTFTGPIELRAAASGTADNAEVNAALDLDGANLLMPALRKPAGTPLRAEFKGHVQPAVIDIQRLALVLGPLAVSVHGTATPSGDFDLQLDSIKAAIDPLLRLLPQVTASIPAGTTVAGDLALAGHVKKKGSSLDGDVKLQLAGAQVKTPALELLGGAHATATLRSGGSDTIDATVDLGPARILVPGTMDKGAGVPMRIAVGLDRAGDRAVVREAVIDAPGVDVAASGFSDAKAHRLELKVARCDIDLAKLAGVMPMLRDKETLPSWLADGRIHLGAGINGDPARPETLHLHVDNLDLAVASGHIRGHADVVGLDHPKNVSFQLVASGIDFDRILGTQPASDAPAARPAGKSDPVVPKVVKTIALDGRVQVDRGRVKGVAFSNFDGKVSLKNGKGRFDTLKLNMFDGAIVADGSTVDLNVNPPRFSLKTRFQNIHLGQLIAFQSPSVGNRFDGHGSMDVNLDGAGLSWAQIAPQLAGQIGMAMIDARVKTPSIGGAVVGQLLSRVNGLNAAAPAISTDEISLRNLQTKFHVTDGQLRTTTPLTLNTKQGALAVAGGIGLDSKLALTGSIAIPAEVIAQATQGRIRLDGPLPVNLKLGGALLSPQVEVVDMTRTVAVLAASLLKNQGAQMLGGVLGKPLGDKVGGAAGQVLGAGSVDAAKKQLEAEAQKRLQEEQAKLQQQVAEKLRQQVAAQAQQDAQRKLEEEAKKRLGKGLGGLLGR